MHRQSDRRDGTGVSRAGRGNQEWQKKMLIKLVKDEGAVFKERDVQPFLEGMQLFNKAELIMLLADDRYCGIKRLQDCVSYIRSHHDVDNILVPILSSIVNSDTGRPLYKAPRDNVVRGLFNNPGLVEFIATQWCPFTAQSTQRAIDSVAEFLLVATMASVEARSHSEHVKTIARELRRSTTEVNLLVTRLCAIVRLDHVVHDESGGMNVRRKVQSVVCWGSDLLSPGGRHNNDRENFRDIALVPTQEELAYEGKPFLPLSSGENVVIADSGEALLDRNFRLLREDAVGTMRENMADPRASKVWNNARIIGASCEDPFNTKRTSRLYFLVQFDLPTRRKIDWSVGRALPRDGLVVLKRDGLDRMMATIFIRQDKENKCWLNSLDGPVVGVIFHHSNDMSRAINDVSINSSISEEYAKRVERMNSVSDPGKRARFAHELALLKESFATYTMIETSDSFFSYRPVLEALQSKTSVPLAQDIVSLQPTRKRPSYLPQNIRLPSDVFGGLIFNLDAWSNDEIVKSTTLDHSQATALQLALTSRVSLIQGPPGTGKTFIGGLVAQIIRDNSDESILCVCYTNHALDQFLNHMLKRGERRLVRIGGRTKSDELKRYELKELARTKEKVTNDATRRMKIVTAQMHRANEELTECLSNLKLELHWQDLNELFYAIDGNLHVNFLSPPSDDGFQVLGRGNKLIDSDALFRIWKNGEACPPWLEELLLNEGDDFQNVWGLNADGRLDLLNAWKQQYLQDSLESLQAIACRYEALSNEKDSIAKELDSKILQDARIIGATTTGAAKYRDLLSTKSAGVVIVEEAGEVLEPHIISALSEATAHSNETKHLILIGDHKQLRPKVESYQLTKASGHGYDFDVSLFERMILAGYPSAMLRVQHRMSPCISALIRKQTYPTLTDHSSVHQYPGVRGVTDNLLFINHSHPEDGADDPDSTTKSNKPEASFCVEVVRYLLLQGYKNHQITILTPYVGQILVILRELRKLGNVSAYISELDRMDLLEEEDGIDEDEMSGHDEKSIRCASIDNFQGEESDLVVVSLVRSNKRGSIGFMKEEQRVNVLLSRAKHGMFIIGNVATLNASPKGQHVWRPILQMLTEKNRIQKGLPTVCQLHPNDIVLCQETSDFNKYRPNGGCTRACRARLKCGHTCPLTCHPTDINHVLTHKQCVKPCRRIPNECHQNHPCTKLCNEDCGQCVAEMEDTVLLCGHVAAAPTCHSVRNNEAIVELTAKCREIVQYVFPGCGHLCNTTCCNSRLARPICEALCGVTLDCGHPCLNQCGKCDQEHKCKQKCGRTLFCGHVCGRSCHGSTKCNECMHACVVKCVHSKCINGCSEVCSPCVEECDWQCEHQGKCSMVCGAPCERLPCGKRCTKLLDCGHRCPGVCGEDCPTSLNCAQCCTEEKKKRQVDMILFTEYQDLDLDEDPVNFLPCGHFFSMSTLDGWMQLNAAYKQDRLGEYTQIERLSNIDANTSKPKSCPDCRSMIHSVKRYGRLISTHNLRASERKHIIKINMKLSALSSHARRDGLSHEAINKLVPRLDILEGIITKGPMLTVFQACGGSGLDAPAPPPAPFLQFLRLKGFIYGRLVKSFGDEAYATSIGIYAGAITVAEETRSIRQSAQLIIDKTRLILQWSEYSDSIKRELLEGLSGVMKIMKNIDSAVVDEAAELHRDVLEHFDPKKQIKEVLKAMNIVQGYNYGGSWSDHWFECPNGHPYFIG